VTNRWLEYNIILLEGRILFPYPIHQTPRVMEYVSRRHGLKKSECLSDLLSSKEDIGVVVVYIVV